MKKQQGNELKRRGRTLGAVMAAGLSAAMTGGCANLGSVSLKEIMTPSQAAKGAAPSEASRAATGADIDFPAPDLARWKQGSFPNLTSLRTVRDGIARDHVRELIGGPHFGAGMFGTSDWDYLLHFHLGSTGKFVTCQFKVRFDEQQRVSNLYWKTPECNALVNPRPVAAVAPVAPVQSVPKPEAAYRVSIGSESLFRLNGAAPSDLLPMGRESIARVAADIRQQFRSIDHILVVGHTDRLGSEHYNNALSLARAQTVRDLLVQGGIDPKLVRVRGDGMRAPLVDCAESASSAELARCLQPNRRVELEVFGAG